MGYRVTEEEHSVFEQLSIFWRNQDNNRQIQWFFQYKKPDKRSVYQDFLCPIIPYQEQLGNYNMAASLVASVVIIPYQEQLGNYNMLVQPLLRRRIIPYQEQLGNYNLLLQFALAGGIIPYQEQLGNYN